VNFFRSHLSTERSRFRAALRFTVSGSAGLPSLFHVFGLFVMGVGSWGFSGTNPPQPAPANPAPRGPGWGVAMGTGDLGKKKAFARRPSGPPCEPPGSPNRRRAGLGRASAPGLGAKGRRCTSWTTGIAARRRAQNGGPNGGFVLRQLLLAAGDAQNPRSSARGAAPGSTAATIGTRANPAREWETRWEGRRVAAGREGRPCCGFSPERVLSKQKPGHFHATNGLAEVTGGGAGLAGGFGRGAGNMPSRLGRGHGTSGRTYPGLAGHGLLGGTCRGVPVPGEPRGPSENGPG